MATVQPTVTNVSDDVVTFSWNLTTANVDGAPVGAQHANFADRAFSATGTWGTATLQWQGSNDGTNWFMLNDPFGVDLTLSANGMFAVAELPLYMRPMLTVAGSGATITVIMVGRKQRSGRAIGG